MAKINFIKKVSLLVFSLFVLMDSDQSFAALLTYSFDDGHISVYTKAFPILKDYNQMGTVNVVSNYVRWANWGASHLVNSTQLIEMQESGWEIISHSKTHPHFSQIPQTYNDEILNGWSLVPNRSYTYQADYNYNQLPFLLENGKYLMKKNSIDEVEVTPGSYYFDIINKKVYIRTTDGNDPSSLEIRADSVQRELEMSKKELIEMGLTIQNFVVPYSDWSESRGQLATLYYNSVGVGHRDGGWFNTIPPMNKYWLTRRVIINDTYSDGTPLLMVQNWVEQAIQNDYWLILMFHTIGEDNYKYSWSENNLKLLVEWVNEQNIKVVTQQQGINIVPVPSSILLLISGIGCIKLCQKLISKNKVGPGF